MSTDWKKTESAAKNAKGKTIESMDIRSHVVLIIFTDGTKLEIECDYDETYGFSADVTES